MLKQKKNRSRIKKKQQKQKKVLLINIALRPNSPTTWLPIGLGYIATSLKNADIDFDLLDIEVNRYSDEEIEKYLEKNSYDIYC